MNESFVFLEAYYDDAMDLPKEYRGRFLEAIAAYGIMGEEPDFSDCDPGIALGMKIAFKHAKHTIDIDELQSDPLRDAVSWYREEGDE